MPASEPQAPQVVTRLVRFITPAVLVVCAIAAVGPDVLPPEHKILFVLATATGIVAVLTVRGGSRDVFGVAVGWIACLGMVLLVALAHPDDPARWLWTSTTPLIVAAIPLFGMALVGAKAGVAATFLVGVVAAGLAAFPGLTGADALAPIRALAVLVPFAVITTGGSLLIRALPRALGRADELGDSLASQRRATTEEGQRRASARLLHDTVLATLTLLAHGGRGVDPAAVRAQADSDATLLRQLRLGEVPNPVRSGGYAIMPAEHGVLTDTLASLSTRFRNNGLNVEWHGTGHVLLPEQVLNDLVFALAECLENVRRHAGVGEAHVTLNQDEQAVRVMVTDAGAGFDPSAMSDERLGLRESVIGRIEQHGGSVRVFSAVGAGTTIAIEVPR